MKSNVLCFLKCSADAGVRSFVDQVSSPTRQIIMLIGADCSVSTEPIAEISHRWNLVQVAYISNLHIYACRVCYGGRSRGFLVS